MIQDESIDGKELETLTKIYHDWKTIPHEKKIIQDRIVKWKEEYGMEFEIVEEETEDQERIKCLKYRQNPKICLFPAVSSQ